MQKQVIEIRKIDNTTNLAFMVEIICTPKLPSTFFATPPPAASSKHLPDKNVLKLYKGLNVISAAKEEALAFIRAC